MPNLNLRYTYVRTKLVLNLRGRHTPVMLLRETRFARINLKYYPLGCNQNEETEFSHSLDATALSVACALPYSSFFFLYLIYLFNIYHGPESSYYKMQCITIYNPYNLLPRTTSRIKKKDCNPTRWITRKLTTIIPI